MRGIEPTAEASLLRDCLCGDRSAQYALYERYRPDMFRLCLRYSSSREEAEDMLQDGFITVFRDLDKFRSEGALGGWVRQVILRTALQHLRRRRWIFEPLNGIWEDPGPGLEQQTHNRLDAQHLTLLLQRMPSGYRTIFNLFVVEGYPHEEIAEMLGISASTSKTQLFKARNWLQARLPASLRKTN
jgi:RNA polymerase sigma factor (sigma-70 family)